MTTENGHDTVDALIAYASRDGMGEEIDMVDVEIAIADLYADPMGPTKLRRRIREHNNKEVCATLEDWFMEAARQRDADAANAARPSDKIMGPTQAVSLGAVVTGVAFGLAGSMALPAAGIMALSGLAAFAGTSIYRMRLSRREDGAKADAVQIRRLAQIAAQGGKDGASPQG